MSKEVWAVVYEHRHGTDVHVYRESLNAKLGASSLMLEWVHEVDDLPTVEKVIKTIEDGDFTDALGIYNEAMTGREVMSIERCSISTESSEELVELVTKRIKEAREHIATVQRRKK